MEFYAITLAILLFTGWVLWPRRVQITRVVDGDSLEGIYRGKAVRIRIAGYDAPEYSQPSGKDARHKLASIAQAHTIRLFMPKRDFYGRHFGNCIASALPLSWRMVAAGYGWPETKIGIAISIPARIRGFGLWGGSDPMHPNQWRRLNPYRHPNQN